MRNITPVDTFTAPVTVLEDTDPVSEASTQPTIQALTNRTENCNTRLVALGTKDAASGVVGLDSNKHAAITASGGNATALTAVGNGTGAGISATGGTTGAGITAQGGATSGAGVVGTGTASAAVGVAGTGGATGAGMTATGGVSGAPGIIATGTVAQPGVSAQGGASGNGVTATGGASSGSGIVGNGSASGATGVVGNGGSGNAIGVVGTGSGTAEGARFAGGTSNGDGVRGTGGATNGIGVVGFGVGTGAGGYFDGQGDGTGASDDAIVLIQNIKFQGSNPASSTGFSNRLTPANVVKSWGNITGGGAGAPTVNGGFNVTASRADDQTLQITFGTPMANANYAIIPNDDIQSASGGSFQKLFIAGQNANGFQMGYIDASNNPKTTSARKFYFTVLGVQ